MLSGNKNNLKNGGLALGNIGRLQHYYFLLQGKESDYDFDKATKDLTQSNKMMSYWFHGKCKMESSWCT